MTAWQYDLLMIFIASLLVLINGFFVGAEFALVKIRESRIDEMVNERRPFASTARWLAERLDASLSACQLGITMASLGLGWIGEPAVAHLIRPLIVSAGISSEMVIHGVAFAISFTAITALHLVLGEQAPKIAALRRPEPAVLICALPLKIFSYLTYPFMAALNSSTAFLLRKAGIEDASEHEVPHSEEEIRALLMQAHIAGELSRSEHRLINAVFEFDEEQPEIVTEGPQQYNLSGNTSIAVINQQFGLKLEAHDVDTIAGLMMARSDQLPAPGDKVELAGAIAEVLEVRGPRTIRIRLTLLEPPPEKTR